jgi:hypothetical protein
MTIEQLRNAKSDDMIGTKTKAFWMKAWRCRQAHQHCLPNTWYC